jgi:Predicted phosphohydrolases
MKIAYASDLHLEFDDTLTMTGLSGVDVLILAGDVDVSPASYATLLRRLRLVYSGPVLFVLGNHEYYHGCFPEDQKKYREAITEDDRAWVLENEAVTLNGVRFLGATLWTDFAGGKHLENCRQGMSDFWVIKGMTPAIALQTHQKTLGWLDAQFAVPGNAPTVIITHHAPSFLSQHPRFAGSAIAGGFCSNLDARIFQWQPFAWIHGHLHDPVDYRMGKTRILSNPWGYPGENWQRDYRILTVPESVVAISV